MHAHLQGHTLTNHAGGGAERWGDPKGRGRGITPEPGRRTPRDGFTDRWVGAPGEEPSPVGRPPRMEKWAPEGGALTSKQALPALNRKHLKWCLHTSTSPAEDTTLHTQVSSMTLLWTGGATDLQVCLSFTHPI